MIKVERFYVRYHKDLEGYLADNDISRDQIIAIKMDDGDIILVYEDNK